MSKPKKLADENQNTTAVNKTESKSKSSEKTAGSDVATTPATTPETTYPPRSYEAIIANIVKDTNAEVTIYNPEKFLNDKKHQLFSFFKKFTDATPQDLATPETFSFVCDRLSRSLGSLTDNGVRFVMVMCTNKTNGKVTLYALYELPDINIWEVVEFGAKAARYANGDATFAYSEFITKMEEFVDSTRYYNVMLKIARKLLPFGYEFVSCRRPDFRYENAEIVLVNLTSAVVITYPCDEPSYRLLVQALQTSRIKRALAEINNAILRPYRLGCISMDIDNWVLSKRGIEALAHREYTEESFRHIISVFQGEVFFPATIPDPETCYLTDASMPFVEMNFDEFVSRIKSICAKNNLDHFIT